MKPLLQIALDETSFDDALAVLSGGVGEAVDIIEAGTLLIAAEGHRCVAQLRQLYPQKIIVADLKMADAGKVLCPLMLDAGADYMTVICAADPTTMALAATEAKARGKRTQIELYGPWTMDRAKAWRDLDLDHIIYHHSRDGGKAWDESDLAIIRDLVALGFYVTVTGGLNPEHLQLFAGIPVFAFIAGRSIKASSNPLEEVKRFHREIAKIW